MVEMNETDDIRALVFANGDLNDGSAVQAALHHAPDAHIIAADGGAQLALACGLVPDVVVGDMDSLPGPTLDDLRARGTAIQRYAEAKDETDLELALAAAVARQARWIRVLGAVGSRMDQTLANVHLLALDDLAGCDVRLVSGQQTIWLVGPGRHELRGTPGDTLSLLPLVPGATGITTVGLTYPLENETLHFGPARGVSNVLAGEVASVSLAEGLLLVVHTVGKA
ncbi:MAG: thiamine diphosphokinase [Chloroflexi bacterium]|nr:thiamine diphosphokinase [Chloroflexota bacterium]